MANSNSLSHSYLYAVTANNLADVGQATAGCELALSALPLGYWGKLTHELHDLGTQLHIRYVVENLHVSNVVRNPCAVTSCPNALGTLLTATSEIGLPARGGKKNVLVHTR